MRTPPKTSSPPSHAPAYLSTPHSTELVEAVAHLLHIRESHPIKFGIGGGEAASLQERAEITWSVLQELSDESDDDYGETEVRPPAPFGLVRAASSMVRV